MMVTMRCLVILMMGIRMMVMKMMTMLLMIYIIVGYYEGTMVLVMDGGDDDVDYDELIIITMIS